MTEIDIPEQAYLLASKAVEEYDLVASSDAYDIASDAIRAAAPLILAANPGAPLAPMPDVDQHVADARTALDLAVAAAGLSREAWLIGVAKAHKQLAKSYELVVERLKLTPESAVFEMAISARTYHYSEAGELRNRAKFSAVEWPEGE